MVVSDMAVYETMKNSNLPWIGVIPSHWEITRIKELMQNVSEKNHPDATVLSLYREYGVLPKDSRDDNHNVTSLDTASYKFVRIGELVINKMKAWQGSFGVSEYEGIVSPAYYVCRFTSDKINAKYFHYLIRCKAYVQEFERLSTGMRIGQWDLGIDDFMCTPAIIPPVAEQSAIAAYLDDQCAKIDTLISEAKTSIEEYKQWKASLIYEAVTKGLDPNVEMKDSGVEWIGKIPTRWTIGKIKHFAELMPKCDFSALDSDDEITFTPMDCIKNGYFENQKELYKDINGSYTQYAEGDIVLAKVTPCFENGNAAIMKNLHSGLGLGSSELFVLRTHDIIREFLFLFIRNPQFIQAGCATMTGTGGLKRVSSNFIKNCPITIPDTFEEQTEIVNYINKQFKNIDLIISEKQAVIVELENYKKSLIFETVTGKRKVV